MPRRLLMAGGGSGAFTPPTAPTILTLTSSPHGGYTMIPDDKAVSFGGYTYWGWITSAGAVELGRFNESTQAVTTVEIVPASDWLNADTHGSPSCEVMPDGRLRVIASRHDGSTPYVWTGTNVLPDVTFGAGATPGATIGGTDYTYMSQRVMASGDHYLFYRDISSGTGRLAYSKNLGARHVFYTGASGIVPYWRIGSDRSTLVHFFATDREWYDQAHPSKVGHFYLDTADGSFHKSDGTTIVASQPFTFSDITLVRNNTDGMVWSFGVCIEAGGTPAAILMRGVSSTDNALETARWRSGAWQIDEVGRHGGIYSADRGGPGGAIHRTDPDTVYFPKLTSGRFEMFRFTSPDDGATWTAEQLTSGSAADNMWVETVTDSTAALRAIWLYGTFLSSTDTTGNTLGVRGLAAS